jgi:hypothetical protein
MSKTEGVPNTVILYILEGYTIYNVYLSGYIQPIRGDIHHNMDTKP